MKPQYSLHRLWIWSVSIICLSSLILLKCYNPCPLALAFVSTYQRQRQQQTRPSVLIPSMFTGIVEEMGKVVSVETRDDMILWDGSTGTGTELVVQAHTVLDGAYLGCSICVSGVCLTATELSDNMFKAGLAPETLRRTYLGELTTGDLVNLERASVIGGRNSGHFVQGHVDGTGSVKERWVDNDSLWYKIETTKEILKYIVPKGFIAVDGTSLTVVDVNLIENWFTFMLVEYTQKKIVIPTKVIGDLVNLEVDILGKYSDQSYANIVLRLETLEAQVERLERKLSNLS